jgi:nucleoside-diphosphate kinase
MQRTLSIIKPDVVEKNQAGEIISVFENNKFKIIAMKKVWLSEDQAKKFYYVHKEKKFYNDLVNFMTSGPCIVMVLEKKNAITENRRIMGSTNPKEAEPGTIRKIYGTDIERNAVHGSDAPETAKNEIAFFFSNYELLGVSG